ncbi:hypothetical protein Tco_0027687 [Tanacetum coccineum]
MHQLHVISLRRNENISKVFIVLVILLVFLVAPVDSPILAAGVDLHESTTYLATGVDLDESTNEVHKLIESTTEVVIVDHVFKEESTEVVQAPEVFDVEDDFD